MATTFDLTTYALEDRTRFSDEPTAAHDVMDDGSLRVRVLRDTEYREFKCIFTPRAGADVDTLVQYLRANVATEFDLVHEGTTYRGYFMGKADTSHTDGDFGRVTMKFRGAAQ